MSDDPKLTPELLAFERAKRDEAIRAAHEKIAARYPTVLETLHAAERRRDGDHRR